MIDVASERSTSTCSQGTGAFSKMEAMYVGRPDGGEGRLRDTLTKRNSASRTLDNEYYAAKPKALAGTHRVRQQIHDGEECDNSPSKYHSP